MLAGASVALYGGSMSTGAAVDELDAMVAELTQLRWELARPGVEDDEDALWELEVALQHLSQRAAFRANLLRRQIELINAERRSA
jgi:hypothetical protein